MVQGVQGGRPAEAPQKATVAHQEDDSRIGKTKMTISYVIECGWQPGRYYAGKDKGTSLRWVSEKLKAAQFPSSHAATEYAQTVLHIDNYKIDTFASATEWEPEDTQ